MGCGRDGSPLNGSHLVQRKPSPVNFLFRVYSSPHSDVHANSLLARPVALSPLAFAGVLVVGALAAALLAVAVQPGPERRPDLPAHQQECSG